MDNAGDTIINGLQKTLISFLSSHDPRAPLLLKGWVPGSSNGKHINECMLRTSETCPQKDESPAPRTEALPWLLLQTEKGKTF